MPYRHVEGFSTALSRMLLGLQSADYTTLFRKIQQVPLAFPAANAEGEEIVVAVDSSGIKVTKRGKLGVPLK